MFEIDERIVAPQLAAQLVARDQCAALPDEQGQDTKELVGQQDSRPLVRQLTRAQMQHELAESYDLELW